MRFPKILLISPLLIMSLLAAGCGYTTSSALPGNLKSIHVENLKNNIAFTTERNRNIYLPLLEVKARDAIIDRFLFDGNLLIRAPEVADLVLKGELIRYERNPLRYTDDDDVEEYRVQVILNLVLWDIEKDEVFWEENGFVGEADYFVSGPTVGTESEAVEEAILDLARRVVERTIENW